MFEIFKSFFRCLNIKSIWPEFAVILLSLFVTCCDAPWTGALCTDGRGFKWIPVAISNPGVITILFIISPHYVIVSRGLTPRRITSDCHRQGILFVTFIYPPCEIKNWTWVSLKDEILPRIESMLEIGVRCWVKWIYRGTVTESIPRISTNTKLTATNIQQKKVESLLLIEFLPGSQCLLLLAPLLLLTPALNLVLWERGNMSWSFNCLQRRAAK